MIMAELLCYMDKSKPKPKATKGAMLRSQFRSDSITSVQYRSKETSLSTFTLAMDISMIVEPQHNHAFIGIASNFGRSYIKNE